MNYQDYVNKRLSEGVTFSIGQTIRQGFNLFGKHVGPYIGFLIVFFIIAAVAGGVAGLIPFVGSFIVGIVLTPALMMGFAIYCHKGELGEHVEFSNFFDGFKSNYTQLVLVNLILQIVIGLMSMLLVLPYITEFTAMAQDIALDPSLAESVMFEIMGKFLENWWMFLIYIVVSLTIQILYMLANYFVVFYDYGFWEAMEASRQLMAKVFFKTILFGIVLYFIIAIGTVVTLGIGLLFLMPAVILMIYSIFDQVAGFEATEANIEDDLII